VAASLNRTKDHIIFISRQKNASVTMERWKSSSSGTEPSGNEAVADCFAAWLPIRQVACLHPTGSLVITLARCLLTACLVSTSMSASRRRRCYVLQHAHSHCAAQQQWHRRVSSSIVPRPVVLSASFLQCWADVFPDTSADKHTADFTTSKLHVDLLLTWLLNQCFMIHQTTELTIYTTLQHTNW